ncbi:hypothetical protein [Oceanobacillus sp. CF4.6]|uniref:hypothetical protein n=1 Tax=Oceanobacillus sp. CF4.6 TaxID=3373080 RepID=UPI003EE627F3
MAFAICPACGGTVAGGENHKCKPIPFNVFMNIEDKYKLGSAEVKMIDLKGGEQ